MDSLKLKGGVRRRTSKRTSKKSSKRSLKRTSKRTSKKTLKKTLGLRNSKKMSGGAKRYSRRKVLNKMVGGGPITIKSKDTSGKDVSYIITHGNRFKINFLVLDKEYNANRFGVYTNGIPLATAWDVFMKYGFGPMKPKPEYKELNNLYKNLGCIKETPVLPFDLYDNLRKLDIYLTKLLESDKNKKRTTESTQTDCTLYEPDINEKLSRENKKLGNIYNELWGYLKTEGPLFESVEETANALTHLAIEAPSYQTITKKYIHKQRKL